MPGAPSAIKISTRTDENDGVCVSWQPSEGEVIEYVVYLAMRNTITVKVENTPSPLTFMKVYNGISNSCTLSNEVLSHAHIDTTSKPTIVLRIAARNAKGFGPATQIKWIQDPDNLAMFSIGKKRAIDEVS